MFWFLIFLAIGVVAGVALSNARTPRIRLLRTFAVLGVATGVMVLILLNSTAHPEFIAVSAIAITITEAVWTARTWGRIFPEAGLNFRDIVIDELLHPSRLRIAYAHMLAERHGGVENSLEQPDADPDPNPNPNSEPDPDSGPNSDPNADPDPDPDDPPTPGSSPS